MAQNDRRSEAFRNIITGVVTMLIALAIGFGWESGTDWPKVVLLGGLIVGGYTAYKGISTLGN